MTAPRAAEGITTERGALFLVGTPIGNLGDITLRALETLKSADIIAAEDTRQVKKLLSHYGIGKKTVTSYHEHNKTTKGPWLIAEIMRGRNIALVSDAGMPGISDPGADLVKACIGSGLKITVIPGPTALITGLVASGLDTGGFIYCGFFPREKKERKKLLEALSQEMRTIVFYESPHRLLRTLREIREAWGDRQCCVARELTKVYEEYLRGTINEVISGFEDREVKGEVTLVIAGRAKEDKKSVSYEEAEEMVENLVNSGLSRTEAVKKTAKLLEISRKELYSRVMK